MLCKLGRVKVEVITKDGSLSNKKFKMANLYTRDQRPATPHSCFKLGFKSLNCALHCGTVESRTATRLGEISQQPISALDPA